jgi:hypothetical protein
VKFLAAIALLFAVLVATGNIHFYFHTSSADAAPSEEVRTVMAVEDRTDLDEATTAIYQLVDRAPRTARGAELIHSQLPALVGRFGAAAADLRAQTYALDLSTATGRRLRARLLRAVAQHQWAVGTFGDEIARLRPTWSAVRRFDARSRAIRRRWQAQLDKTLDELSAAG